MSGSKNAMVIAAGIFIGLSVFTVSWFAISTFIAAKAAEEITESMNRTMKIAAEKREKDRLRQEKERQRLEEIKRQQAAKAAYEEQQRLDAAERDAAAYRAKKADYQKRNAITEKRNKYLLQLKEQCDDAHQAIRDRPSREATLHADETCAHYLSEVKRMESKVTTSSEEFHVR